MGFDLKELAGNIAGQGVGYFLGNRAASSGGAMNNQFSAAHEGTMYARAMARGLTPQEYYGSPAPGSSPSGSAQQVIGNQMQQTGQQMAQLTFQASENQKNRDNQKDIAKINTGSQQIIADKALQEKMRQFNISVKPKISRELKILDNTIATGDPRFIEKMKKLSMGTENMFVELVNRAYGLESFDDFNSLTKEEQIEMMNAMLAGGSYYRKELAGLLEHAAGMGWPTQTLPSLEQFTNMANEAGKAIRSILKSLGLSSGGSDSPPSSSPPGRPTLGSYHEPVSQPGEPFRNSGYR